MKRFAMIVLIALFAAPGRAQVGGDALRNLIEAAGTQPTTLRDLDASWSRVVVARRRAGQDGHGDLNLLKRTTADTLPSDVYYTRGRTIEIAGHTYLVAFQPVSNRLSIPAILKLVEADASSKAARMFDAFSPTTGPDAPLNMALIDAADVYRIEGIRTFDLAGAAASRSTPSPIAAIRGAILYPIIAQARIRARTTASLSNLRQLALAIMMFAYDHDETLPPLRNITVAKRSLAPYAGKVDIFTFPGTNEAYITNPAASRVHLDRIRRPDRFILAYESRMAPDHRRSAAFADGHVRRVPEAEWSRVWKAGRAP
jgi:prepilin-type processing-associated H-X9-DG protein